MTCQFPVITGSILNACKTRVCSRSAIEAGLSGSFLSTLQVRRGRSIPSRCLSFFLGRRRRGPRPGPPPGRTRRRGCPELRAGGGAGRGAGGGPGGVTWRAAAAEAEVTAPASEGVRCRECPQPGRRAAARGTPEPAPAAGARPGEWPGRV